MFSLLLAVIYLAFIGLGLPDSLLGAAWPVLHAELGASLSWSGVIFMIISAGTVASSLACARLVRALGTGRLTLLSTALTCASLFGFSVSRSVPMLCLMAIPYGLGAGAVDAALNNYVALRYASRHMSWLHCMWGVGAALGPYVMSGALLRSSWAAGYRTVGLLQLGLTAVLLLSLPLWKKAGEAGGGETASPPLSLGQILRLPGSRAVMLCFFCYCAVEQTVGLWACSYLVDVRGLSAAAAAGYGGLFFAGLTAGRALSGFLTMRFSDERMIRLGAGTLGLGLALIFLPADALAPAGLVVAGLGCAPIYPCVIHSTPAHFGAERSPSVIGVQMASAYLGTSLMPPLFGLLSGRLGLGLFPVYLLLLTGVMAASHEALCRRAPFVRSHGGA